MIGKSIGQLEINYRGFDGAMVCTATLISQRLLITNYHCVYPVQEVSGRSYPIATARLYMNYHQPNTGRNAAGVSAFAVLTTPVEFSEPLDYAILEIAGSSPASQYGYVPIRFAEYSQSTSLFIIHHLAGGLTSDHKRITFRDCQTLDFAAIGDTPIAMPNGKEERQAISDVIVKDYPEVLERLQKAQHEEY